MKSNQLKQLKKILLLSGTLTVGATGCNENNNNNNTKEATTINQTINQEINEENSTESIEGANKTIDYIIGEFNDESGTLHSISDYKIDERNGLYLTVNDGKYYDNYHLCSYNDPAYSEDYVYVGDESYTTYVVKVNVGEEEDYYVPIAALTEIDNQYHNVTVTTFDGDVDHEPSAIYIHLDEDSNTYDDLRNGQEYLDSLAEQSNKELKKNLK